MKKILSVLSVVALALGATSCEDWLEMDPYASTDSKTIFANEQNADSYVAGCYRGLIVKEFYYQLGAGDGVVHSSEDGVGGSKYYICNFNYDSKTPYTLTTGYKEAYGTIEATNLGIKNLLQMPETDKRNALLAELYSIRAFAYYNLIRVYGDMPAVWEPMESLDPTAEATFYPHRAPRDEIYDHIIADMQQWIDFLPTKADGAYGGSVQRLTRDGAYALLGRIALYAAGYSLRWNLETLDPASMELKRRDDANRVKELYQIASDACQKVMQMPGNDLVKGTSSMSAYQNLWYSYDSRNFATSNTEFLWQQACYGDNTNSDFNRYAHPGSYRGTYGTEKAMQNVLPTYYLSFDAKDQRRDVNCAPWSCYPMTGDGTEADAKMVLTGTTYSCILLGKYRQQWRVQSKTAAKEMNLDIPLLRFADVLLGYAEAQAYLNGAPTGEAIAALQRVRERAGIGDMPIPGDLEGFIDALAQERKWEFAGELWLRTDLIRMNRLDDMVRTTQKEMMDLSDKTGKYSGIAKYRLYKLTNDNKKWADASAPLTIEHIDITDPAEVAIVSKKAAALPTKDKNESAADYAARVKVVQDAYQAQLKPVLEAHGVKVGESDIWYAIDMFMGYVSEFNTANRKNIGFTTDKIHVGVNIANSPTGSAENGNKYPAWIHTDDNSDGIYFAYQKNKVELLPLADATAGHPRVDNPNLSQHPGYAN